MPRPLRWLLWGLAADATLVGGVIAWAGVDHYRHVYRHKRRA